MFIVVIFLQWPEEVQFLMGLFDDVAGVDVPFQSVTGVGAVSLSGLWVGQRYGGWHAGG